MGFYSLDELNKFNFKSLGENVLISKKCSIYGSENISIGDNVRIDDFSILSGNISIGSYIHISAGVYIFAGNIGVELHDFSGISSQTTIYAISDDFSGDFLIGPMVDDKYRNVISQKIIISKYVQIGTGCRLLPGAFIGIGSIIGANSLVKSTLDSWRIYVGTPVKDKGQRLNKLLVKSKLFLEGK